VEVNNGRLVRMFDSGLCLATLPGEDPMDVTGSCFQSGNSEKAGLQLPHLK
jgi:hypothetical protein